MTFSATSGDPVVSVIMPFLNAEPFVSEAIESVLGQTYERWELLLVDDGCSDGTRDVALRYLQLHPDRLRLLEHPQRQRRGTSAARNLGLRHARGEFVTFLDADDVFLPQKLAEQMRILARHSQASIVYGPTQYWYSWTDDPADATRDWIRDVGVEANRLYEPAELVPLFLSRQVTTPCICSLLVRRTALERAGRFEESFWTLYEDQAWYVKLFLHEPAFVDSGCWDRYRQHPASMYMRAKADGTAAAYRLQFLRWVAEYLREQGGSHPEVERAVAREVWPYDHPRLARMPFLRRLLSGG